MGQPDPTGPRSPASVRRAKGSSGDGIFRVLFMTRIRDGVPVPVCDGPVGEDEGVDSFNDFLAIIARCLPDDVDAFARAAYLWAGLRGRVALGDAIPTFPWPTEDG